MLRKIQKFFARSLDNIAIKGKYDEAIATLQSIPTKTADVQAELAYTYRLAGKQQEAATLYSRLAKAAKGNIGLDLSAAQAWINVGQPDASSAVSRRRPTDRR